MTDIYITGVFPSADGNFLSVEISNDTGKEKFRILETLLEGSGLNRHSGESEGIRIDEENYIKLKRLDEYTKAVVKGINLLSYSQNTSAGISRKLFNYGFSKETCEFAGRYLKKHGYINEELQASLLSETLATKKLYGKMRIEKELKTKGFPSSVISKVFEDGDYDFDEICKKRILKTVEIEKLGDGAYRQKMFFKLRQYGFSTENITKALEEIYEEK